MTEEVKVKKPRIGVFVCHCGSNIAGVVDVPSVTAYAKTLTNVVHTERNLYTCADDGLRAIKTAIKEHELNRVVVASCTPRTHAPLFQSTCKDAGLNPYLFEFVNIRDQCSWVHMHEPEKATQKAKDLIRMGVARASLLEPQEEIEIDVEPSAMVIGAGVSGITCSLTIANHGFNVYLVERKTEVGGMVRSLNDLYPTNRDPQEFLKPLIERLERHERIKLYTSSIVKSVDGFVGNFDVTISHKDTEVNFKVGTIIVATGAEEFKPIGLYGYGKFDNVITQLELENALREGKLGDLENIVVIQCVGARGEAVSYCSRICCMVAIKNALILQQAYPSATIHILHNDIQVYGDEYEESYKKSREMGIRFIKYSPENCPEVIERNGEIAVKVYHELFGRTLELPSDLVVLSTPLIQHSDAPELSKILKVPLGQDNFFFEAHVKLRPADFATDGMYLCGTANGPKDIPESISQALGAASRALIPLTKGNVRSEAITAVVNTDLCTGCGLCEFVCPCGAAKLTKTREGKRISQVNEVLCKGCGACGAGCPEKAITMRHFTDEQLLAQVIPLAEVKA